MDLLDCKRIAEKEAYGYRASLAFAKGYEDSGGNGDSLRYQERLRWIWALERVQEATEREDPNRMRFLTRYYGWDRPRKGRRPDSMVKMSMELYASPSTLYQWREGFLYALVCAAIQCGAMRPFSIPAAEETTSDNSSFCTEQSARKPHHLPKC